MNSDAILIVDDEADIALILKLQLEDAGFVTTRARDGVEALELLARERFTLMLLDIKMPRMDGLEVLREVSTSYPDLVVIMMTAHGSEEIAVAAMKKGAVDYIAKPFSTDDMLKRVERAIQYNRTQQENRRLQAQLSAEQQKTEAILQGMADLLVAVDRDGCLISVNRKTEQLLGKSRDQLLGRPLTEVLQADIAADRLPSRLVQEDAQPCLDVAYTIRTPSGPIPVLANATPLLDSAGRLVGSVEIIRDISTLKALEQEKEDFVSMLTHDLKSPITAIVGSLDLVREGRLGPVNADQREFIESAEESCAEMVEMINTLLDIHKFEAGKMVLRFQVEDVAPLLEKIVAKFVPAASKAGLALTVEHDAKLPPVTIDRNTFTRLIGNLLSNALKFTPKGGRITVTARLTDEGAQPNLQMGESARNLPMAGRHLLVTVQDSGVGIPAEALSSIFDRFVQAKNRREGKTKGTGLGLAFCRKVMDAHRGLIWAESQEGVGSKFSALFPLAPPPSSE
ncbi:MAG TPA: response regulator [Geobacteraceae bacterium]